LGYVGGGFLSAFLEKLNPVVELEGDPIVEVEMAGSPGAGGIAYDGTYLYLNNAVGKKIYVYTPTGTLIRTMNVGKSYTDIDYDALEDEIVAVTDAANGIDRINKLTGALVGTYTGTFINYKFTAIAMDRLNDRIYLTRASGVYIYALALGDFSYGKFLTFPFQWSGAGQIPATIICALDVDGKKLWVSSNTIPSIFGRIDVASNKLDAYRILGTSFNQAKLSIGLRYVNGAWYYWGDSFDTKGRLFRVKRMPAPSTIPPALIFPALSQDTYRWYIDDSAENPTPKAPENTGIDGVDLGNILRLRLGLKETAGANVPWSYQLKLQYATNPAGPWLDIGEKFSWYDGKGADGDPIQNLLLSNTTFKQFFVESSPSRPGNAYASPDRAEWDLCVQAVDIDSLTDYYFRVLGHNRVLASYPVYPQARSAVIPLVPAMFELREHKTASGYTPGIEFTKSSGSVIRVNSTPGARVGDGYIFRNFSRSQLDGCTIRIKSQAWKPITYLENLFIVVDGHYDRESMTDFPANAARLVKGAGTLDTIATYPASYSWAVDSKVLNLSGGTLDECCLMLYLKDGNATYGGYFEVEYVRIFKPDTSILVNEHFEDSVHMEVTGTTNDYGYISAGGP